MRRGTRADTSGAERHSTIPSTDGDPRFTGRGKEFSAIDDALQSGRVAVIHGPPGLGKSRLAMEYAHRHADAYPGGTFFVRFDQPPPTDLAKLLRDLGKPAYPDEPIADQCRRALRELGASGRALLIYDAIADERTLRAWLPYDGLDWHLIVTSTSASWARPPPPGPLGGADLGRAREGDSVKLRGCVGIALAGGAARAAGREHVRNVARPGLAAGAAAATARLEDRRCGRCDRRGARSQASRRGSRARRGPPARCTLRAHREAGRRGSATIVVSGAARCRGGIRRESR